jgi:UDP-N-acetylmuramyl pentapeptide phosphotransferase/UDP-N-acetylglucosamine-1-phosphate transferase
MTSTIFEFAGPAFLSSLLVAILIVTTKMFHGKLTFDGDHGVQKVHTSPTPRVGGIALFFGILTSILLLPDIEARSIGLMLLLSSLPAFLVGLTEDITNAVSPRIRLFSHLLSASILVIFGGYILRYTGFQFTDPLMKFTPFAIFLSVFAIAGVTNAVNIIDGYHGLASGTVLIMSAGLALLAARLGDGEVFIFSSILFFAMLGFFFINFPFGKLFLGDAGAYFSGFLVSGLAIIITVRNPGISPWVPLLIIIYPVWELLISIMRRLKREGHSPSQPDNVHLHHLVSRSIARPLARHLGWKKGRNPATSLALWPLPLLTCLLALNAEMTSISALLGIVIFQAFYERIYRTLSLRKNETSIKNPVKIS